MKVKIKRTSDSGEKPCDGAVKETYDYEHIRTCTEEEFNERFSEREGLWRSEGYGHATTNGNWIVRYDKDGAEDWFINIDDLKVFILKHGQCVVSGYNENNCELEIEIYDDYRE